MQNKEISYKEAMAAHDYINHMASTSLHLMDIDSNLASEVTGEYSEKIINSFETRKMINMVQVNNEMIDKFVVDLVYEQSKPTEKYLNDREILIMRAIKRIAKDEDFPGKKHLIAQLQKAELFIEHCIEDKAWDI